MSSVVPRRQHTVTQAVLRHFTDPATNELEVFNLTTESFRQRPTRSVGFVWDFVEHDPVAAEGVWGVVEDDLPLLYSALDDGTLPHDPAAIQVAIDLLALHDVRSLTRKQIHEVVIQRSETELLDWVMEQREYLSERFFERRGFYPAGDELFAEQAQIEVQIAREQFINPEFFQERLMSNFEEARRMLSNFSVEVLVAGDVEFMISDDPAVRIKHGYRGLGPLTGVAWDKTNALVMPVSPKFAISMAPAARMHDPDDAMAAFINRVQLSYAHDRVFYNPNSGLRSFAERAPTARRNRPPGLGPSLIELA